MSSDYIPDEVRMKVRLQAGDRCGYCLSSQKYVMGLLEVEHIMPRALGGTNEEENLWLACRLRNTYNSLQIDAIDPQTSKRIKLFNPRTQKWFEQFAWSADGIHVTGLTPCGRATVAALRLNNQIALTVRQNWVVAGWHPPKDE